MTDDNAYFLRECVDSLGAQRHRAEEVVLVVTGTAGFTTDLVRRSEATSPRIRVLPRPGSAPSEALAAGVAAAQGTAVLCHDTGDLLDSGALAALTAGLGDAPCAVALPGGGAPSRAFTASIGDVLFRRRWLARHAGLLALGEPLPELLLALGDDERPAVVDAAATSGLERGHGLVFGAMPRLAGDAERFSEHTRAVLSRMSDRRLDAAPLARHLVEHRMPAYLADAERCDDAGWRALAVLAADLLELAGPSTVPVVPRVAAWLAAENRREEVLRFLLDRWQQERQFPAYAGDGELLIRDDSLEATAPVAIRRVTAEESRLRLLPRSVLAIADGLDLEIGAVVPHLPLDRDPPVVTATLDGTSVAVTCHHDPEVDLALGDRYADSLVLRLRTPPGQRLAVTVDVGGVHRTAHLDLDPTAPAAPPCLADVAADDRRITGQVDGGPDRTLGLVADPWGLGTRPRPTGPHRWDVVPGTGLAERLPLVLRSEHHRIRVRAVRDAGTELDLGPPLDDDEVGARNQQRLREQYAARAADPATPPPDPGVVLFTSYLGQGGDSPAAIHDALRRLRPGLRTGWVVADASVAVPDGAEPVQVRSRDWYDALLTAGQVVTNIDLDPWFVKRPGQRVLQTYHGHPSKVMGRSAWEAKGFPPSRVAEMLRRTRDTWDLLVAPSPEAERLYREQFAYDGEVVTAGYPRNDVLLAPDRQQRRVEARRRLGVRDGQRAVLYAPTWRDDLATNHRVAPMDAIFDVDAAAEALGEDWVVLVRGHRFHRHRGHEGATVLDVTEHPRIEDLLLASDAAVLDYSSVRFDYALTDRPMLFLVPDRERYAGTVRGFLHEYVDTAPGPLLDTTEEVVGALRRLDNTDRAYATARAAFRERFWSLQDDRSAERVVEAFWPG